MRFFVRLYLILLACAQHRHHKRIKLLNVSRCDRHHLNFRLEASLGMSGYSVRQPSERPSTLSFHAKPSTYRGRGIQQGEMSRARKAERNGTRRHRGLFEELM